MSCFNKLSIHIEKLEKELNKLKKLSIDEPNLLIYNDFSILNSKIEFEINNKSYKGKARLKFDEIDDFFGGSLGCWLELYQGPKLGKAMSDYIQLLDYFDDKLSFRNYKKYNLGPDKNKIIEDKIVKFYKKQVNLNKNIKLLNINNAPDMVHTFLAFK